MSIANGEKVIVEFTQPLIGDIIGTQSSVGNETKFLASFDEYTHVPEGSIFRTTRHVQSIEPYATVSELVNLDDGTKNNLMFASGMLVLAIDEG